MKNITTNAKKRWLGDYDDDDPFDPPQEPQDDEDPGRSAATGATAGKRGPCAFTTAFRSVVYAPTEDEFNSRWGIVKGAFSDQHIILRILLSQTHTDEFAILESLPGAADQPEP
ncbi:hypothetical protein HRG_012190 [Hirsutella rhossiliensis]